MPDEDTALKETIEHLGQASRRVRASRHLMPHRALVDTKEYENGKVVSTKGSWEAGVDGAKPGIIIPADPKVGQSYYQEYYPGEAMDMAKVLSLDASVTVPYGSFDRALESREWTPLQPGFSEKKYYVAGVGRWVIRETKALIDVKHR
jgi:hypothetical protein